MTFDEVAALATAFGVAIAAWQLYLTQKQAKVSFEDSLAQEYRKIAESLPVYALLGDSLEGQDFNETLDNFYHYFDLCNSQIFLRQQNRVSKKTWHFWSDGIRTNMSRPAFRNAWRIISSRAADDFSELRKAISENYRRDPKGWK